MRTFDSKIEITDKKLRRKFKMFTPESFTQFCMCMGKVALYEDFHSYYCTFKFDDLLPSLSQHQIGEICLAFFRKKITHGNNHPVETRIKRYLVEYLIANTEELTTTNMTRICLYLSLNFPRDLSQHFSQFQDKVAEENIWTRLSLKDLITIAASNPHSVSKVGFVIKLFFELDVKI